MITPPAGQQNSETTTGSPVTDPHTAPAGQPRTGQTPAGQTPAGHAPAGQMPAEPPEPVTAAPIRPVRVPALTMRWLDLAFLHWPLDPDLAAPFMPSGVRPDTLAGVTYVGLVAFRMHQVGFLGLPGLPYLGSFPETNVRLYSVGPDGRRGVVFLSLDAARLLPATAGRAGVRLPYQWAGMRVRRDGDVLTYASIRRWPAAGPRVRLRLRIGERVAEPSALEHFVTARWGLHAAWYGGTTIYLPNEHPPWELYRAEVTGLTEDLVAAAGLPAPAGPPVSVLYSPGVPVRAGLPRPVRV
jgi:uncharacterized protein